MTEDHVDPAAGGPDPVARQLLQQAQLIARLRADLDQLANEAADTVAGLLTRLEDLESRPGAAAASPAAWCWRDLGPHAKTELMDQLETWTAWLRHRYPLARRLPGCWARHPEVVEDLTALWLAWEGAYQQPDAPLTAAADWHDRWLPGVLHRLEHGPFALDCADTHSPRPETSYADAIGPLSMQNRAAGGTSPNGADGSAKA
jgi:hypothetical protein